MRTRRYLPTTTLLAVLFALQATPAYADGYFIHHDGGGSTILDAPTSSRTILDFPYSGTQGEKLAAVVDTVDGATTAMRAFSASAGGLFMSNLKK